MSNVIIIDHYDSFVFNILRYVLELNKNARVISCNIMKAKDIMQLSPSHLIFSPGPCGPDDTGVSSELMRLALGKIPILGICLGSLVLYQLLGGEIEPALMPRHGESILLEHSNKYILQGLSKYAEVGLYHSLMMGGILPEKVEVIARCKKNQLMAIKHVDFDAYGLQFHPESILTLQGKMILKNFLLL